MTDHEARELPVQLDVMMLEKTGNSTWTTDAGSFDVLADLKDRVGHSVPYEDLITRSVILEGDGFNLQMASLDDIIAAKTFANRPKDLEALPDLLSIQNRVSGFSPPADTPGVGPQPGL
jgi:hypothetical protein